MNRCDSMRLLHETPKFLYDKENKLNILINHYL